MKNRDIERLLAEEITRFAPAEPPALPEALPAPIAFTRRASRPLRPVLAFAAALLVLLGSALGYRNFATFAVMDLDVNPSIELRFNSGWRVISASALNEDAKTVLGGMDLRGTTAEVAVNALVGSMLKNGYLTAENNSVLVSVDAPDEGGAQALIELAEKAAESAFEGRLSGALVGQRIMPGEEARAMSALHQISRGKAQLIQTLIAQNPALSFDALSGLPVHALNLMLCSKPGAAELAVMSGTASTAGYIGSEAAIRLALRQHGLEAGQPESVSCEMDYDFGRMVYEVEFVREHHEYEVTLDARDGRVLEWETEWQTSDLADD